MRIRALLFFIAFTAASILVLTTHVLSLALSRLFIFSGLTPNPESTSKTFHAEHAEATELMTDIGS